jgi:uncharacterized protein (DUF169 family)
MNMEMKEKFITLWKKYFDNTELPITFYYTDEAGHADMAKIPENPTPGRRCIIGELYQVRKGKSLCYGGEMVGCSGGKRYLGFAEGAAPNFEYFLSYGIPGKMEGERFKKTPEIVKEMGKYAPRFKAPAKFVVFKRWDMLEESDNPEVVTFFAKPDVIAGLFTLANFDEVEPNAVFTPFCAGCGSAFQYPYLEGSSERPRCVLGMFDITARPCVTENDLTFAAPMNKFARMVENMEESFLITHAWELVHKRISKS